MINSGITLPALLGFPALDVIVGSLSCVENSDHVIIGHCTSGKWIKLLVQHVTFYRSCCLYCPDYNLVIIGGLFGQR